MQEKDKEEEEEKGVEEEKKGEEESKGLFTESEPSTIPRESEFSSMFNL